VSEESTVNDDDVTVEEQAEIVQGFVEGLVDAFGYDAEVTSVQVDDETIEIQVAGSDLGLLVGPRGNTLQAIHDLSRTVVQRQAAGTHHGRVRLDIAGYRERRREALERFTQKVAEQALSTGVAQVLEPMSAADRKVVHDTVNEIDGVHTVSEGEDARRHVVIVPDQD
jgi:spoIIIJ-associated protein